MDAWGQRELPRRAPHAISRELDGEYVVLNTETDEAHHLAGDAAAVWQSLETRSAVDLPVERVQGLLEELTERGLLAAGMSSRRTLLRAGAVGGAAVAVAGIQTLVLPEAAWAGSNPLPIHEGGTYQVPSYVTSLNFTLAGAGGGGGSGDTAGGTGGRGGDGVSISGSIQLPPNQPTPFTVEVLVGTGGLGGTVNGSSTGTNYGTGFSRGGNGGRLSAGGGGGASAIIINGVVVVVAGAGGGGGRGRDATPGGNGGSATGFNADGSSPVSTPTITYSSATTIALQTSTLGSWSVSTSNETLTFSSANARNLVPGNIFRITATGNSLNGTNLVANSDYRVVSATVNPNNSTTITFTTGSGQPVDIQGSPGTPTPGATVQSVVSFTAGSSLIAYPGTHGLAVGDKVNFTTVTGANGISASTQYFVTEVVNGRTIRVSSTENGSAISAATFGTATGSNRFARQVTAAGAGVTTNGPGGTANGGAGGTTNGTSPSGPSSGDGAGGAGGTGGAGANGSGGTVTGTGATATRSGGAGGVNTTSANRTGGGGGGGWGPGGGGEAGVSGSDDTSGAGGGAGSSYYGGYAVSLGTITTGGAGGTSGAAGSPGGSGGAGSVVISAGS